MSTTNTPDDVVMEVMHEVKDHDVSNAYIGQCKWFNNSYGYGFLTIWDGPEKGTDIFVHHSGIKPLNSMYKTLKKGEYVMFDVVGGDKGKQAVNVRGICNGPLLCDHVQIKRTSPPASGEDMAEARRMAPMIPGVKRKRIGDVSA